MTLAQAVPLTVPQVNSIQTKDDILGILNTVVDYIAVIFFGVAVLFVFYAGWLYLKAAGDPATFEKAREQLIYAAVAIAVGLIAYSFTNIVTTFL